MKEYDRLKFEAACAAMTGIIAAKEMDSDWAKRSFRIAEKLLYELGIKQDGHGNNCNCKDCMTGGYE